MGIWDELSREVVEAGTRTTFTRHLDSYRVYSQSPIHLAAVLAPGLSVLSL